MVAFASILAAIGVGLGAVGLATSGAMGGISMKKQDQALAEQKKMASKPMAPGAVGGAATGAARAASKKPISI